MNVDFTCSCQMKIDLENSADVFSFFEENYSLPAIADNLDTLSPKELRCACCLMGVALVALSQKKTIWERLKTMGLGNKEYPCFITTALTQLSEPSCKRWHLLL